MQTHAPLRRKPQPSEEGYVLVAVIFLLALLVLSLSIAIPQIKASIELDRERETMQRGKQYARAIKLYYKKFNAYPPSVEALVKTSNIRFLRKRYTDPMTGKDDWRPIRFGENKTPMAMGFFGQPLGLGGSAVAGTGASGGNSLTGSSSLFPDSSTSSSATSSGLTGTSGIGGLTTGSGTTSTSSSSSGQTFGGTGIIGFAPGSTKHSILLYKKKDHFNEWEFLYSPLSDSKTLTSGSAATGDSSSTISPTSPTSNTSTITGNSSSTGSSTTNQ